MHRNKIIRMIRAVKRKRPFTGRAALRFLRNKLYTKGRARKGVRDNRRLY